MPPSLSGRTSAHSVLAPAPYAAAVGAASWRRCARARAGRTIAVAAGRRGRCLGLGFALALLPIFDAVAVDFTVRLARHVSTAEPFVARRAIAGHARHVGRATHGALFKTVAARRIAAGRTRVGTRRTVTIAARFVAVAETALLPVRAPVAEPAARAGGAARAARRGRAPGGRRRGRRRPGRRGH